LDDVDVDVVDDDDVVDDVDVVDDDDVVLFCRKELFPGLTSNLCSISRIVQNNFVVLVSKIYG